VATYFVVILLTLVLISVYILNLINEYTYRQRKVEMFTTVNILANFAADSNFSENIDVSNIIGLLDIAADDRAIFVDKDAKVIFDTSKSSNLKGKTMVEHQIINALKGENDAKKIEEDGKLYVSVAVPVIKDRVTLGAIYLQAPADDMQDFYVHIRNNLIILSIAVSVLIGLFSFTLANVFASPILTLAEKIKEMSETDSRQPVEIKGSKEVNELVTSFNIMVERLNEFENRRQEFVSNASHELKTPLSSIKLICDSILQTPNVERETIDEFLSDMNNEVDRLTRIINKLLSLTKLDASVEENEIFEYETTNLKDLTEAVIRALEPLATRNGIIIEKLLIEDAYVRVEADKIWEAIYNILDNSIKYTPEGGRVYVELYRDFGNIYITISDNGIGMAKEETQKIFDRFYRVDKARARETGGTGLGLSIAQSSVELHGGHIEVESREDEGSLFRIVLPAVTNL